MDDLREMAKRITDVVNGFRDKPALTPETVDLEMVAELCWAIGVTPHISFDLSAMREPTVDMVDYVEINHNTEDEDAALRAGIEAAIRASPVSEREEG